MGIREKNIQAPEILSGWKSIARHLEMGVRTVQRYERQMGLPIRRPAGKTRGAVLATKSELNAWIAASPIRESFQLAKASAVSQSQDVDAIKRGVAEMRLLRHQMVALRIEVRDSMQSLRDSIQTLRTDLWPDHSDPQPFSELDIRPQTRRLLTIEDKSRKVS